MRVRHRIYCGLKVDQGIFDTYIKGYRHILDTLKTELPGVRAEGGKVVIELERAAPYLLQALAESFAVPVRADFLAAHEGKWTDDAPVTGPYRLGLREHGRRLTLLRNDKYWGAPPAVAKVELTIVTDEATGANLFQTGGLDIMTRVPALETERFKKSGALRTDPFLATYYLGFNLRKAPFNDRVLRRAVAASIRKGEIALAVGTGETPARSWIPPGLEGFVAGPPDVAMYAGDVEEVRRRRLSSGAAVQAGFDSGTRNSLVMEKVQADLLAGIGLRILPTNLDWQAYIHSLQTDPAPIFRFAWLAPFRDPVPHLQVFTTGNANNYTGWSNPAYDALVTAIEGMTPGPERAEKVRAAQKILVDDEAVVVPLYHYVQTHGVAARVTGFRVNPFGVIRFNELGLR